MKKIIALFIALAMIFSLAACGSDQPGGQSPTAGETTVENAESDNYGQDTPGKITASEGHVEPTIEDIHGDKYALPLKCCQKPSGRYYARKNNLKIESVYVSKDGNDDCSYNGSYYIVSGLKNKEVEKTINKQIKDLFDSLYLSPVLPNYTGIVLNAGRFSEEDCTFDCVMMDCFNYDNILSIVATHDKSFSREEENTGYYDYYSYSVTETLNFDLNTGKQILLQNLIADGIDFEAYFNEKIMTELDRNNAIEENYDWLNEYEIHLVAPFSGIRYDQKYYINQYSGEIVLIFDDKTPDFLTTSYPVRMFINVQDAAAYPDKFSGEYLFEDDTDIYRLYSAPYDESTCVNDGFYDEEYFDEDIVLYGNLKWYSDAPNEAIEIAKRGPENDSDLHLILEKYLELQDSYSSEGLYAYADYYSDMGRYGKYTYVTSSANKNISDQMNWNTLWYDYDNYSRCYDENGKTLALTDVFICDESEIKGLIEAAWMKNAERESPDLLEKYGISLFNECFEEAYNSINGFYVSGEELYFTFEEPVIDICAHFFADEDAVWWLSYANYEDIGCDKLNIFH